MRDMLVRKLSELNMLYGSRKSAETLAVIADLWTEDFVDVEYQAMSDALDYWRRNQSKFPTPAEISEVISKCGGGGILRRQRQPCPQCDAWYAPGWIYAEDEKGRQYAGRCVCNHDRDFANVAVFDNDYLMRHGLHRIFRGSDPVAPADRGAIIRKMADIGRAV